MFELPTPWVVAFLFGAATLAGFVDAVVGGGGLITLPAMLVGLQSHAQSLPVIMGTTKMQSCAGTTMATWRFFRSAPLPIPHIWMPMLCAMGGAVGGVQLMVHTKPAFLQFLMLFIMVALLIFTLVRPNLGHTHAPKFKQSHQHIIVCIIALIMGFYDGFFGPGAGSLLIFLFVMLLGFDFLRASTLAKYINWSSNMCAVVLFVSKGSFLLGLALIMAVGSMLGGFLGVRFAIHKGSRPIRWLFVVVVSGLIARFGYQLCKDHAETLWQLIHRIL